MEFCWSFGGKSILNAWFLTRKLVFIQLACESGNIDSIDKTKCCIFIHVNYRDLFPDSHAHSVNGKAISAPHCLSLCVSPLSQSVFFSKSISPPLCVSVSSISLSVSLCLCFCLSRSISVYLFSLCLSVLSIYSVCDLTDQIFIYF